MAQYRIKYYCRHIFCRDRCHDSKRITQSHWHNIIKREFATMVYPRNCMPPWQIRGVSLLSVWCWATVCDTGPYLYQHRDNIIALTTSSAVRTKRQYLLALQVSRYCLLVLQSRVTWSCMTIFLPHPQIKRRHTMTSRCWITGVNSISTYLIYTSTYRVLDCTPDLGLNLCHLICENLGEILLRISEQIHFKFLPKQSKWILFDIADIQYTWYISICFYKS